MLPVFYINLDGRSDREQFINKQLDEVGLSATRVSAVLGRDLTEVEKNIVNFEKYICVMKRPINDGEIGCALSHRKVWQRIVDEQLPYALVLEDDVTLDHALKPFLNCEDNYNKFDVINLASAEPYYPKIETIRNIIGNREIVCRPKSNQSSDLVLWQQLDWRRSWNVYSITKTNHEVYILECNPTPASTNGYIVSLKGAGSLLQASDELFVPIDYVWRYAPKKLVQGFLAKPLITQAEFNSDIQGSKPNYQMTFAQKLKRIYYKNAVNPRKQDVKLMYKSQ